MYFKFLTVLTLLQSVLFHKGLGAATKGPRCYTCINARSNEECNQNGFTICRDGEVCQNELRVSTSWRLITKRCKQRTACESNYMQNLNVVWYPSQCNPSLGKNSVCRCCCNDNFCNERELPCINETNCDNLASPPNARKFCTNGQRPGSTCSFVCLFGYRQLGNGRRRCDGQSGLWSASSPVCQLVTCRNQQSPQNGLMTCSDGNRFRSRCRFTCNQNYTVRGSDVITCGITGRWSERAPSCEPITCPEVIEAPEGAQMDTPQSYVISSQIAFSCDAGYYVRGNPTITCTDRNDDGIGEWDSPVPECNLISCPTPIPPNHGFFKNLPLNIYGSIMTVYCEEGYFLIGQKQLQCLDDNNDGEGEWSQRMPTCRLINCSSLSPPRNGRFLSPLQTSYGTILKLECDRGYFLIGESVISCQDKDQDGDGSWNSTLPDCIPIFCPLLPPPENGFFQTSTIATRYGSILTVGCREGFHLNGSDSLECLDPNNERVGEWSAILPTCEEITCQPIIPPANSQFLSYPQLLYGVVLTLECNEGYFPVGNNVIRCEDNDNNGIGTWNNSLPGCELIMCPPLNPPENGRFSSTIEERYGSILTMVCKVGYFLIGQNSLQCSDVNNDGIGEWNGEVPTCIQITCPSLNTPSNGKFLNPPKLTFGSILTPVCNEGYFLSDNSSIRCEDNNNDGNGTWNNTLSECNLIYCPSLIPPQNGKFRNPVQLQYGSNVSIACDTGFFPERQTSIRCIDPDDDGIGDWSENIPGCRPILCPLQGPPANGSFRSAPEIGFGSVLTIDCYEGYFLSGENNVLCGDLNNDGKGEWNRPLPSCKTILCNQLSPPENGYFQSPLSTRYGSNAVVFCDEGYFLLGENEMQCTDINGDGLGEWSRSLPFCRPIACPLLTPPANGKFQNVLQTSYGSLLEVECNNGYFLVGNSILQCGDSDANGVGDWTSRVPTCRQITCRQFLAPENSDLSPQLLRPPFGSEVNITCNERYFLTGSTTLRCEDNDGNGEGEWSDDLPTCQLIRCPILLPPSNGRFMSLESPKLESIVRVVCNRGFTLKGDDVIECLNANRGGAGRWNATLPTCERILCPSSLGNPPNGLVALPPVLGLESKATYVCNRGYFLNGSREASCQDPDMDGIGEWIGKEPECILIQCPNPTSPPFGEFVVSSSSRSVGTQLFIVCQRGYYPIFREIVVCWNQNNSAVGVWQGRLPTCNLISCPSLPAPSNGIYNYSHSDLRLGTIVSLTCDIGYRQTGVSQTQTCTGDGVLPLGQWSGNLPTCRLIICEMFQTNKNGNSQCNDSNRYGSLCLFSCNYGYRLVGEGSSTCTDVENDKRGEWRPQIPDCEKITCSTPLSNPANGNISCNDSNNLNSECHFSCSVGYYLLGNDISRCLDAPETGFGNWSADPPLCQKVNCQQQPIPRNGASSCSDGISFGSMCLFECDQGYSLIGRDAIMCDQSQDSVNIGIWTEEIPICQSNQCEPPPFNPINGTHFCTDDNLYRSTCEYACAEGYNLIGSPTRECLADKTWSSAQPQCELIQCQPLPNVENALMDCTNGNFFGSSCTYMCEFGYQLLGNKTLQCLADQDGDGFGEYDSVLPQCHATYCPEIDLNVENGEIDCQGGISNLKHNIFGSTCVLICNEGWASEGVSRISCNSAGRWTATLGRCRRYNCLPPLLIPVYGTKTCTAFDDVIGTTCAYRCESGTRLEGSRLITCLENGSWSNIPPTCVRT